MSEAAHGFVEGQEVWVQDGDGKRHAGILVGETKSASWLGGVPSAHVADPETHEGEVVSISRITPRAE
jgi:hypothetical protein